MKRRFGYINMTKEIEETLQSTGKQMEELYDEIEKLKIDLENKNILIKEKDIKIKNLEEDVIALNDQIEILNGIINKNENIKCITCNGYLDLMNKQSDINECDTCFLKVNKKQTGTTIIDFNKGKQDNMSIPIDEDIKEKEIIRLKKELEDSKKEKNEIQDEYIKIQNENNKPFNIESDIKYQKLKDQLDDLLYEKENRKDKLDEKDEEIKKLQDELNNKEEIDINKIKEKIRKDLENEFEQKYNQKKERTNNTKISEEQEPENQVNKLLKKYPIKVYKNIGDNKILKMIAAEVAYAVKYQCKIAEETARDTDNITMDEVIDYIIQQEGLSQQDRSRLKFKFERCVYLDKKYGDKLGIFKFSIYNIGNMSKKNWVLWLQELDLLIKDNYKDEEINEIKCEYIFKKGSAKGSVCGVIDCKKHTNIN